MGVFDKVSVKLIAKTVPDAHKICRAVRLVNAEITNYEFTAFEIKIVGFTDDAQKDIKLAIGAYVAVTDGETTEYSYMQNGDLGENEKYCFVSYNDIVGKNSTEE